MSLGRRAFLKRAGAGAAVLAGGSGILAGNAFAMNPSKFQAKSDVSFVGSSSSGTRRKMIADVLEPWRQTVAAGIAGKTVLIKPNMVCLAFMGSDQLLPVTHVDAVRGLIDFLRSISSTVPIIISDLPALSNPNITSMFSSAGYTALTSEYSGVTLADLSDTSKIPSVDRHFWTPGFSTSSLATVPISSAFINPNYYLISICRPKTHNCMVMTGVNKNVLMAAPILNTVVDGKTVNTKNFMHGQDGWSSGQHTDENKCLAYNLYQMANVMYSTGAPALSVLDAWEGMEGDGPASGTSIMQYCAVAGIDPLAVDRLSAKLMGFSDTATDPMNNATPSYTDMRALVWISNAGFGNYDLSKINFLLGSLAGLETYVKTYKLAPNYTGAVSYETNWTASPPPSIFDVSIKDSRSLDPRPYLVPQLRDDISAGEVKIDFTLPVSFMTDLGIYNTLGIEVRKLGSQFLQCGRYTKVWDRRDNNGSRVPAGNYIIKLGFGSGSLCDKITIVN
jgi:uncharacterized protein (DUF362 family)